MTDSPFRIIRLLGLASGEPSPIDGQYVVDYDPSQDGVDTEGNPTGCLLVTDANPLRARQYSISEAMETWRKVDVRNPTRPDGKPNRPLTAYTVEIGPPPPGAESPAATASFTVPVNFATTEEPTP